MQEHSFNIAFTINDIQTAKCHMDIATVCMPQLLYCDIRTMAATFSTQQHLIARRHTAFSSPRTQSCAKKHRSGLHSIVPYRRVHAHERCVLVRAAAEEKGNRHRHAVRLQMELWLCLP